MLGGHDTHLITCLYIFFIHCHIKAAEPPRLILQHRGRKKKMRAPQATSCGLLSFKLKKGSGATWERHSGHAGLVCTVVVLCRYLGCKQCILCVCNPHSANPSKYEGNLNQKPLDFSAAPMLSVIRSRVRFGLIHLIYSVNFSCSSNYDISAAAHIYFFSFHINLPVPFCDSCYI